MSKYNSKRTPRTMPNGSTRMFDSKSEAERYDQLRQMLERGEIRNLKLQPTFTLQEAFVDCNGEAHKAITYKADFTYEVEGSGYHWNRVIEDVKGIRTKEYLIKRKLMADKGLFITEV